MVEECVGLNRIAQLQHIKSEHISQKAVRIIELFSPDDDQTDEEIVPSTIKVDEENRHRGNKGHKGGKRGTWELAIGQLVTMALGGGRK